MTLYSYYSNLQVNFLKRNQTSLRSLNVALSLENPFLSTRRGMEGITEEGGIFWDVRLQP
jgi:hypothetical protein